MSIIIDYSSSYESDSDNLPVIKRKFEINSADENSDSGEKSVKQETV